MEEGSTPPITFLSNSIFSFSVIPAPLNSQVRENVPKSVILWDMFQCQLLLFKQALLRLQLLFPWLLIFSVEKESVVSRVCLIP